MFYTQGKTCETNNIRLDLYIDCELVWVTGPCKLNDVMKSVISNPFHVTHSVALVFVPSKLEVVTVVFGFVEARVSNVYFRILEFAKIAQMSVMTI